jgi:hypothetical protein
MESYHAEMESEETMVENEQESSFSDSHKNSKTSSESTKGITVLTTNNEGGRTWDKKHICFYCQEPKSKMPRHLIDMHSTETEVTKIAAESDKNERNAHFKKLVNLGDHLHNCEVLRNGHGSLIVGYRPTKPVSHKDYGPCEHCYLDLVRSDLWKHKCPITKGRLSGRPAVASKLLLPLQKGSSSQLQDLLKMSKNDDISMIMKIDTLLLEYGERCYLRHGHNKEMHSEIRGRLRRLARLLKELRLQTKKQDAGLSDFIEPSAFRSIITAVKQVAGFDDETHFFELPSLALKNGMILPVQMQ